MILKTAFVATVTLGIASLVCLIAVFLAATDIWHEQGSPDFWRGEGVCALEWQIIGYGWWLLLTFNVAFLVTVLLAIPSWRAIRKHDGLRQ
jgi:hypothetical protein